MVEVPAGSFLMGSAEGEDDSAGDEGPQHRVRVAGFLLGKTEVTQRQWRVVMGSNPSHFKGCDDCPVENVSWDDIQGFLQKLNARTGKAYRLPSEAEWEYACRAGGQHRSCGGDDLDTVAWVESNSGGRTHPVGQKRANAWGLHDMNGNVLEWTQNCWHDSYRGAPLDGRAWTSGDCRRRVLRGGAWNYEAQVVRPAYRVRSNTGDRSSFGGFRVVLSAARTRP